jgi:hypothetical protein
MSAIVTTNNRAYAASQFMSGFSDSSQALYLFIGRTLPWIDENSPPTPIDCESEQSNAFRDMMSLKKLLSTDTNLVIPRNQWTLSTVYTQYANDIDLFDPSSGLPPVYVITDQLNVYKCLNNNNGAASTVSPSGTATSVVTLADGYQWKFMYTVNSADVLKFVTNEWIPVRKLLTNDGSTQWLVQQAAIPGTIDRIDLTTAGTQYTQIPTVTIVGDGTGATATATIGGGNVLSVTVTSTGQGYSWANVVFSNGGVSSNGASAKAIVSPFLGHGSDPVKELGGFYVLINSKLTYDENNTFTVNNDFRRIGILKNPLLNDGITPATAADYNQSLRLTFGTVSGASFVQDETVTGNTSGATGVVLDFDSTNKILRLVETLGSFVPGETVVGASASGVLQTITGTVASATSTTVTLPSSASSTNSIYTGQTLKITAGTGSGQTVTITSYVGSSRVATITPAFSVTPANTSTFVIASIIQPDLATFKGDILYLENRRPIARAADQVEDVRIVIEF